MLMVIIYFCLFLIYLFRGVDGSGVGKSESMGKYLHCVAAELSYLQPWAYFVFVSIN